MFTRLNRPIHFDSVDGNPIDVVFFLLIPPAAGSEHLAALARLVLELIGGLVNNVCRTSNQVVVL
jgi:mannitol/fructose-specific phosphotransferase system IIA component (Ntr-type)